MLRATGKPKLLVIDDDQDLCELIALGLSSRLDVMVAHDGERGIMMAQASHPDLFLVDLFLPRLSGLAVLRYLKHQPKFHSTPALLMTAYLKNLAQPEAARTLSDGLLTKPFDIETLCRCLEPHLGRSVTAPEEAAAESAPRVQRRAPRVASEVPAELRQGSHRSSGMLRSLSPGGALFESDRAALKVPSSITFTLEEVPLEFQAEVLYASESEGRHLTGLRFRAVTLDDEFRLWRYVESRHALEQRNRLTEALLDRYRAKGFTVLAATVEGHREPRRIRRYAPDVLAYDEPAELCHIGVSLPGFAVSEPKSRGVIEELAGEEMADGVSRGLPMPVTIAVPLGWSAVVRRIVMNLRLPPKARDSLHVLEVPA